MDNRTIDVVSEGDAALALAVKLAWNPPGNKASHYKIGSMVQKREAWGAESKFVTGDEKGTPTLLLLLARRSWGSAASVPVPRRGCTGNDQGLA